MGERRASCADPHTLLFLGALRPAGPPAARSPHATPQQERGERRRRPGGAGPGWARTGFGPAAARGSRGGRGAGWGPGPSPPDFYRHHPPAGAGGCISGWRPWGGAERRADGRRWRSAGAPGRRRSRATASHAADKGPTGEGRQVAGATASSRRANTRSRDAIRCCTHRTRRVEHRCQPAATIVSCHMARRSCPPPASSPPPLPAPPCIFSA